MKITQIRNATIQINIKGVKFLIDPYLAEKDRYPGFPNTMNSNIRNPKVELPFSLERIIEVDAVILTHIHPDHFDEVAYDLIPKNKKIFVQNINNKNFVKNLGFENIEILTKEGIFFNDIKIIKTPAQHGSKEKVEATYQSLEIEYDSCGVILESSNEKKLYIAGDTIWCEEVKETLEIFNPEIIILNAGDAKLSDGTSIIMNKEDVKNVYLACPNSIIIASHMETVNHSTLSRKDLNNFAKEEKINNLLIPNDGESYSFFLINSGLNEL